ncbi:MAG: 2Fe-2S iron-sulfur cluster binding domain-containing protein [Rhizobiales bacterium]|nr:2Fe-2S iron-sulfur cluster binding domain-containing protein [Hyphomicrobiales bacterium]
MTPAQAALRNRDDFDEALDPALTILVTDRDGQDHRLPAEEGWRAMEVIRDWGLDIKAECGGACACATCHVHVDGDWLGALSPPTDEEIDMLDGAFGVTERSRLSCQILLTPEMDGLRLQLVAGTEK